MAHAFSLEPFDEREHSDRLAELTAILHSAYAPLAARNMHYLASHQPPSKTLERLRAGEGYLAYLERELIGTVTLYPPNPASACAYYRKPGVYCFGQFAVDPRLQGQKLGSKMMDFIENRARELGAKELALDTSEHAHDLIAMYRKRGYEVVSETKWDAVNYRSVIMARAL